MSDLYLEVVTPEEFLYEGFVGMVEVPGTSGRFTILRDHGPIISTLTFGNIRIIGKDGRERVFKCRQGVVECRENHVTVLMDRHHESNPQNQSK